MNRIRSRTAAAMALAGLLALGTQGAEPDGLLDGLATGHAIIEARRACLLIDIYLALTPTQRAQGLMYIRELGEHEGMLFLTRQPAVVSMWMKNTYIPLDMLFIGGDGKVMRIAANTTPLSENTISSERAVNTVLELNGGFAARHDVRVGDRVTVTE